MTPIAPTVTIDPTSPSDYFDLIASPADPIPPIAPPTNAIATAATPVSPEALSSNSKFIKNSMLNKTKKSVRKINNM